VAEPHSLKVGDTVTHPQWPAGTKRTVKAIDPFPRMTTVKGRMKLVPSTRENVVLLDEGAPGEDGGRLETQWMEAGLEKVDA